MDIEPQNEQANDRTENIRYILQHLINFVDLTNLLNVDQTNLDKSSTPAKQISWLKLTP